MIYQLNLKTEKLMGYYLQSKKSNGMALGVHPLVIFIPIQILANYYYLQ
jgi:hypothetical protein